jgi:hypothetical protein
MKQELIDHFSEMLLKKYGIKPRDGSLGPGTHPDGAGHGSHFSPVGTGRVGIFTRRSCRVRAGILIHPWVTRWVPEKLKCIFIFNQTFIFDPAQLPEVLVEGGKPHFLKKNQGLVTLGLNLRP